MKHYKKALLVLEQSATPTSKQNKLIKIAHDTEDNIFKELCLETAKMYSNYLKRGWTRQVDPTHPNRGNIPTTSSEWQNMQRVVNDRLKDYINARLSTAKPEWVVMAERHGWTPPY